MTFDAETLVLAYVSAWNEHDPMRCRALVDQCWSPNAEVFGPNTHCIGREALLAEIGRFHRERPGERGILTSGIDCHHDFARFTAAILNARGELLAEAVDIAEIGPDGLLSRIVTFWGPPPQVPTTWPAALIG